MWSDRPDPERLAELSAALGELVPGGDGFVSRRPLPPASAAFWVERVRPRAEASLVWLDGGATARHLIAWDPLATVSANGGRVDVGTSDGTRSLTAGGLDVLAALEVALAGRGYRLFGFVGYEIGQQLEALPPPPARDVVVPDLWLGIQDCWLEISGDRVLLATCGTRWTDERAEALAGALAAMASVAGEGAERMVPASVAATSTGAPEVRPDDEDYESAVARIVAAIRRGDLFQTNLCRRFVVDRRASGPAMYAALRAAGDVAYGAWISTPEWDVLSRSPECFLRVRGDVVESRPIKGTRRRGADPAEDRALREELLGSAKDRAELAMIVDLVRNDLGRVCQTGSVRVAAHAELLELATVWHTLSRVTGRRAAGVGVADLLRATFPPGSITGAPKIQAMVAALAEEPARRGPAMGAIGWIDLDGDLELSVAIRTAVADRHRVVYHAGCGIVADSDPAREREESLVKAAPFLRAFGS